MHGAGIVIRAEAVHEHEHEHEHDPEAQGGVEIKEGFHRIFYWMKTKLGEEVDEVSAATVVQKAGVPQKILLQHVDTELKQDEYLRHVPIAIIFVIVFAASMIMHRHDSAVKALEDTITHDLEENANFAFSDHGFMGFKNMYDVNSYTDFYSWMRLGLRPLVMSHDKAQPEDILKVPDPKPQHLRLHYLNFNRIIGGIRLQQVRSGPDASEPGPGKCRDSELEEIYDKKCVPWDGSLLGLDLHFKPTQRDMILAANPKYDPAMERWLLVTDSRKQLDEQLLGLETEEWVKEDSVHLNVNFIVYNAIEEMLTLTTINVLQSRSGHMWRTLTHETQFLTMYGYNVVYMVILIIVDVVFGFLALYMILTEACELIHEFKFHRSIGSSFMTFLSSYVGFWNSVDWTCGTLCVAYVVLTFNSLQQVLIVRDNLMLLDNTKDESDVILLQYLFEETRKVCLQGEQLRTIASFVPIVGMLRLLKYFTANPRLSVVTRTMSEATTDVTHFGIVFLTVFSTYALAGMVLLGRAVPEFASFFRAISASFRILMGDFDIDTWRLEVGLPIIASWFTSYMILVVLIILGMLLAMIMDTYTDVKGKVSSAERLDEQIYELYRRGLQNRRGERVSLDLIRTSFMKSLMIHSVSKFLAEEDSGRGEKLVAVQDFMAIVPGLEKKQATRLLANAVENYRENVRLENPLALSDAMRILASVLLKLELYTEAVKRNERTKKGGLIPSGAKRGAESTGRTSGGYKNPSSQTKFKIVGSDINANGTSGVQGIHASAQIPNGWDSRRQVPPRVVPKIALPTPGLHDSLQSKSTTVSHPSVRSAVSIKEVMNAMQPSLEDSCRIAQRSLMTKDLGQKYDVQTLLEAAGLRIADAVRKYPQHSGVEALAAFLLSALEVSQDIHNKDGSPARTRTQKAVHTDSLLSWQSAQRGNDKSPCPSPCVFAWGCGSE